MRNAQLGSASMAETTRTGKRRRHHTADRILDTAMAQAEAAGWDDVRLRRVAEHLGVDLRTVRAHYRDLDAVADAWFRRGLDAMLSTPTKDLAGLAPKDRLNVLLSRWFDTLAPHRRTTVQMLAAKLYPSHPHHWVPLIFNLSRLVHWLRDSAGLDAGGRRRQVEEVGLTILTVRPPGDDGALVVGAPTVCGEGHPLAGLVT